MDQRTIKLLLRVLSSPAMVLTESQMLGVLELSNIVGNPVALKAMQFAAGQASATTPATLLGFATTLQNLIKLNSDHKPADYANLEAYIKQITLTGTDAPLTYGMFLTLVDALPSKPLVPVKPAAAATQAAATKRRVRRRSGNVKKVA
jgi:hypothetical protein